MIWPTVTQNTGHDEKTRALEEQDAKVGVKINAAKTKLMRIGTKDGDGVC